MQDPFVGDIGDFGKYALLNALTGDGLRLGVNWYQNTGKKKGGDGRLTDYGHLRACDPGLHDALQAMVQNDRTIAAVERSGILPRNTVFLSAPVSKPRAAWHDNALKMLSGADLVFMDPDTGFGPAGPAYIVPDEVRPYLYRGQSLVIYQHHFHHEKIAETIPRTFALLKSLGCETQPWAFVFRRLQARMYFIVPAPAHVETLRQRSLSFLKTPWVRDKHFELWEPNQFIARREIERSV